jgi:MFS family permease
MYPGRITVLCAALAPLEFTVTAAGAFMVKTLQELHGYSPGQVTLLYICGGVLAIVGNVAVGALSDRLGRRLVLSALAVMAGLGFYVFYNATGWIVAAAWTLQVFAITGASVLFKTLGSELFPTSYRSTASGVRTHRGHPGRRGRPGRRGGPLRGLPVPRRSHQPNDPGSGAHPDCGLRLLARDRGSRTGGHFA